MAIQRKTAEPAGIVNASGQPEIVLEIDGLTLSMAPPPTGRDPKPPAAARDAAVNATS